jgi:hypothetical protein
MEPFFTQNSLKPKRVKTLKNYPKWLRAEMGKSEDGGEFTQNGSKPKWVKIQGEGEIDYRLPKVA